MDAYIKELFESENIRTSTKQLHTILYSKCYKSDLNKVIKEQCQNLMEDQKKDQPNLLVKYNLMGH